MSKWILRFTLCLSLQLSALAGFAVARSDYSGKAKSLPDSRLVRNYGKLPLAFEPNVGQADGPFRFLAHGGNYTVYLGRDETLIALHRKTMLPLGIMSDLLRMRLLGAVPETKMEGLEGLPGHSNYFFGRDPRQWHTGVPTFRKVLERHPYPGIDLIYHGEQGRLEYDFLVSPGAQVDRIRLKFAGPVVQEIDARGNLVLRFANKRALRFLKPVAYQEAAGTRRIIAAKFLKLSDSEFAFQIGSYDHNQPLVIDPVLSYSTYLGGTDTDAAVRIAVDSTGNAYLVGYTASSNFPTKNAFQSIDNSPSPCQFQLVCQSGTSVFVTKLNATGTALVYSTFLGGKLGVNGNPVTDVGVGIAVDSSGNAYVTGSASSTDFPTTTGAFQKTYPGGTGAATPFVTKLSPAGSSLVYSTYIGGPTSPPDSGTGITVDGTGHAYVTGYTYSSKFPTTTGAYRRSCVPLSGQTTCSGDVFVTKLNPTGSGLVYSTYVGGSNIDVASAIAIDSSTNAYITGGTFSADFPTTSGAPQRIFAGPSSGFGFCHNLSPLIPCGDAFVVKLNATGTGLVYSTYLGGSDEELGMDLKVDGTGSAYVTGFTRSKNFPVTTGAFQTAYQGDATFELGDAFVTKVNPTGTGLTYSTHLGGDGYDMAWGIALDSSNDAYVSGITESDNFPLHAPLQTINDPLARQNVSATTNNVTALFVSELNPTGSALKMSTLLGGGPSRTDIASDIAFRNGALYITGVDGGDLPVTAGVFQPNCNMTSGSCDYDAFIAKISFPAAPAVFPNPRAINFGRVIVGTTTTAVPLSITNQGTSTLDIQSIALSSTTGLILSSNTCGSTLAIGATCGMKLAAKPPTNSCCISSVVLTDNAMLNPQIVPLSVTAAYDSVSPSSLTFAAQKVGTTSAAQNVTITNHAGTAFTFTFSILNTNDFGISSNPCGTIGAGKSCVIGVVFHPQKTGTRLGAINISDSGHDPEFTVNLTGTGQ